MHAEPTFIASRDNPLVKQLKRLAHESGAYRRQGRVWLEGEHLCSALRARGLRPELAVFSESYWHQTHAHQAQAAIKTVVIADALWREFTALESPEGMGCVRGGAARTAWPAARCAYGGARP